MALQYHYQKFPPQLKVDDQLHDLLSHARTELGRYDGFLASMEGSEVLLAPLLTQEAVLSSRIEGTQSTLTEVLEFEMREGRVQGLSEKQYSDRQEILNYRAAMYKAIQELKRLPLSQRIIKAAHRKLMQGVRGENKSPGKYRRVPVWIGGASLETARFVPIDAQYIDTAMSAFERYIHNDKRHDDFLKVAILHAEFEAIHPFLDGNGRLGRMIIPLYLFVKGLLSRPWFYISSYFEKNRQEYYDRLLAVSEKDDWLNWCTFFLTGVLEQAKENLTRAQKIIDFYKELKRLIPTISRSQYGITALDFIFNTPVFNSLTFYQKVNIPKPTAQRLLPTFVQHNILLCIKGKGNSPNEYTFQKLIDIADGK